MSDKRKKTGKDNKKEKISPELRSRRETYDWIQCLITALIICVVVFVFFIRVIDVSGSSMNPTLQDGDKMLVSDLFYKPKVGDVVIFKKDEYDPDRALVKRVIATEGQVVNIDFDKGIVYVDGEPIEEDYISELTANKLDFIGPQTVPDNCVFVMGDNRNASTDSRDARLGCVDERYIMGRVYFTLFPVKNIGVVK